MSKFKFYKQLDQMDCGPSCLRMIAKSYGRFISLQTLRERSGINKDGVSLFGLSEAAEYLGFRTMTVKLQLKQLIEDAPLPCILHWGANHFVVVYKIKKRIFSRKKNNKHRIYVADPAKGKLQISEEDLYENWLAGDSGGYAMLLEPGEDFNKEEGEDQSPVGFNSLWVYLRRHSSLLLQLFLGFILGSIFQLLLPFLMQSIVDVGISSQNISFIALVMVAQITLMIGRLAVDFIKNWIILFISIRLNLNILSNFLTKLLKLPISYFNSKQFGDIMQRIGDHQRIEAFVTNHSLGVIFSFFNLGIFGLILGYYNITIFFIFLGGSLIYLGWIYIFLPVRRKLDYQRFDVSAKSHNSMIQIINGMSDIKQAGAENSMRWKWEVNQIKLFNLQTKNLRLNQYQQTGAFAINEGKNIMITFIAAQLVINGNLTLGGMLAIQYIVGQLNSPIEQIINFAQNLQEAKISMERLNEIQQLDNEDLGIANSDSTETGDIKLQNVSFKYSRNGDDDANILNGINMNIPEGKITAIVGLSGSGKTTLLKIIQKFYNPTLGNITVGGNDLNSYSYKYWRSICGVVMQDGYIFSETVARNIAVGNEPIDYERLNLAIKTANLTEFIKELPLGYKTRIGDEGNGLSQGQKQRILIARSVYKDPKYIFLDEATNSLDSENESIIMENLADFFKGRTVVIVAHRLSTVTNADKIFVIKHGKIIEEGSHDSLIKKNGQYYSLIKNQLNLESNA